MMHSNEVHTATADSVTPRQDVCDGLDARVLQAENREFAGTGGVSANNRQQGFAPGYLDTRSGTAVVSRFSDGRPAPIHVLDGLPSAWVAERDAEGRVLRAREGVIAGFIRHGRFFSRRAAALALAV